MFRSERFLDEMRKLSELIAPYGAANGLALTLLSSAHREFPTPTRAPSSGTRRSSIPTTGERWTSSAAARPCERWSPSACATRGRSRDLLVERYVDGRIKLFVTHVALEARRQAPELFRRGDYEALLAGEHVVAFTRAAAGAAPHLRGDAPVVPEDRRASSRSRWVSVWGDEKLRVPYAGRYRDVLTNRELDVGLDTRLSRALSRPAGRALAATGTSTEYVVRQGPPKLGAHPQGSGTGFRRVRELGAALRRAAFDPVGGGHQDHELAAAR